MNFEDLITNIESLLEMNEQADRSTTLDIIREEVSGMQGVLTSQTEEIENLNSVKQKLTDRNQELFLRVDGSTEEETEEVEVEENEDIYEDENIFEDEE